MTPDEFLAIAVIDLAVLVPFAAREWAKRPHYRRVPHRKLRAAVPEEARDRDQRTIHATVAGTQTSSLRLTPLSRSSRDRAHRADGDRPRLTRVGGTQRAACHAHNATPEGGSAQAVVPPSDGLGLKQPVGVGAPPDPALAGSQG